VLVAKYRATGSEAAIPLPTVPSRVRTNVFRAANNFAKSLAEMLEAIQPIPARHA
jgi:hypothetical protein